jgi:hypothetical protein
VTFSEYSGFLHQYNWNIVESGIKHHNPNPYPKYSLSKLHVEVYRIVNVLALKFFIVTNRSVEYKYRADYHTIKLDISLGPRHFVEDAL